MTQRGLLRLTDSERSLAKAVELLRPITAIRSRPPCLDAGLQLARAARGEFDGAARTLESAHGGDGQRTVCRQYAIQHQRRAGHHRLGARRHPSRACSFHTGTGERDGRQTNLIAADAVSLASTAAVAAREFDIADAALATAYRIRDEKACHRTRRCRSRGWRPSSPRDEQPSARHWRYRPR